MAASYADVSGGVLIPTLYVLSVIKFVLVVMWFMHLKFDDRRYARFFVMGLSGAAALYLVVLISFRVFRQMSAATVATCTWTSGSCSGRWRRATCSRPPPRAAHGRATGARTPVGSSSAASRRCCSGAEWPTHDLAEGYLYSMHMVQHMLFTLVAAPLLVAGMPAWMWRAVLRPAPLRAVWAFLARPLVPSLVFNGVLLFTHWPEVVSLSVRLRARALLAAHAARWARRS